MTVPSIFAALVLGAAFMTGCSGANSTDDDGTSADEVSSKKVIVDFNYGNQITHSYLTITSGGTVTKREHVCCGHTDKTTTSKLSASKLKALKAEIVAASSGTESSKKGNPTTFGSSSGAVIATTASGQAVTVYDDARATSDTGHDTVTTNDAPEAQDIIDLVNTLADANIGN
ncbi:MAG: hypothetical protein ABI183_21975 [Polyangiaceae bacterium]